MVKPVGPGVYSATYSNVPVYEFQFGEGLKEHVMRRRSDDWINATHILKAAGFDKPARTRILEREVQKNTHEKVQGGYGKYQGTWVPLEQGEKLAMTNGVYEKLRTIFEYTAGNISPPPAPKHTTAKPKAPKPKPAVPKWAPIAAPVRMVADDYDDRMSQMDNESIADDTTVASASFMADDDHYDLSQQSTGRNKRKQPHQEDPVQSGHEIDHTMFSDELLDYFMVSNTGELAVRPEPPVNFQADWHIDREGHTALHWAAAMGDIEIMNMLKKFQASNVAQNARGETPLMRSVLFTNCQDKQTMPAIVKELIDTIDCVDFTQSTVLHHAAAMTYSRQKHQCIRYYLDVIMNKMQEFLDPGRIQGILDAQDINGDTAIHIAARNKARKVVRALIGRGASTNIPNVKNVRADQLIMELNDSRKSDHHRGSSSPYGPDSRSVYDGMPEEPNHSIRHHASEAAISIEQTITPLIVEKFQDLANSFDEELVEKETSEREANRILKGVKGELESCRTQLQDPKFVKESPETTAKSKKELVRIQTLVVGMLEHGQQVQLTARVKHEEQQANGHTMAGEDDLGERVMLGKLWQGAVEERKNLVNSYVDALGKAGAGENGNNYEKLISMCCPEAELGEGIDVLLESLTEEEHGEESETVMPDGS